jgi:hypothetical protein
MANPARRRGLLAGSGPVRRPPLPADGGMNSTGACGGNAPPLGVSEPLPGAPGLVPGDVGAVFAGVNGFGAS